MNTKTMFMGNLLCGFGNDNIRGTHIKYFENKLVEDSEDKYNDLAYSPNYYAWLCLYTEHIFWYMRNFCFKNNEFDHNDFLLMYNDLIIKFCDTCRDKNLVPDEELELLFNRAVKVLEVRHAIIHKGFPNLLPIVFEDKHVRNKPSFKKGEIKVKFSEESTRASVEWFSNPSNYSKIKQDFESLINICCFFKGFKIGI